MKERKTTINGIRTGKIIDICDRILFRPHPNNYTERPNNYTEKPNNYTEAIENCGVMVALVGGKKSVKIYKDI